ncbi:MAG: hypothetical protein HGA72_02345 [Chlorobiaceae bacterium]|nr:hypothetical protein [Chlorobiaceae bacterium]
MPDTEIVRETDDMKPVGMENDCKSYRELSVINILDRFDSFMLELGADIYEKNKKEFPVRSLIHEIEQLQAVVQEKERELRFFRRTVVGQAIGYFVRTANEQNTTNKIGRRKAKRSLPR